RASSSAHAAAAWRQLPLDAVGSGVEAVGGAKGGADACAGGVGGVDAAGVADDAAEVADAASGRFSNSARTFRRFLRTSERYLASSAECGRAFFNISVSRCSIRTSSSTGFVARSAAENPPPSPSAGATGARSAPHKIAAQIALRPIVIAMSTSHDGVAAGRRVNRPTTSPAKPSSLIPRQARDEVKTESSR
ncbi:MAG TPA: hypothetical protein VLG66_09490, partial [Alphaproteobacteria bacterium]|nr:hypothetical protein [Alphaproteobacteria bacterium]